MFRQASAFGGALVILCSPLQKSRIYEPELSLFMNPKVCYPDNYFGYEKTIRLPQFSNTGPISSENLRRLHWVLIVDQPSAVLIDPIGSYIHSHVEE